MSDLFEKATRAKYRFPSCVGDINTEDLWTLPLESKNGPCLDDIAVKLNTRIESRPVVSFVKQTRKSPVLENKFAIVKHIIDVKLEEADAKENKLLQKAKKDQILQLIADKENTELAGKSKEELLGMINDL